MTVRIRLAKLKHALEALPPPGQFDLVVTVPVGGAMADDLPPGVHFNADGRVATAVFEGARPDADVMAGLEMHLAPSGRVVTAHP